VATVAEIAGLLTARDLPAALVDELVDGLSGTLLLDEPAEVLAADLALCHPDLGPSEVRVQLRPGDGEHSRRITVVAHDRPGLLATTAGALAGLRLSVVSAGAATWDHRALALQGVTVVDPERRSWGPSEWDRTAADLAEVIRGGGRVSVTFQPAGPVRVMASPVLDGHSLVSVEAPDRIGLLWAIASWFEAGGYNVLAARLTDDANGRASDTFLVDRTPDVDQLVVHLAGKPRRSFLRRSRS
jgi:UTP:GlnB (protein PII) uridylyltransferase